MYKSWEELFQKVSDCKDCELYHNRLNSVFGIGKKDAKILFIGEAPGEKEDYQGEPFVGRGGQLLNSLLGEIDLDRNRNIYIANIVKCRPPQNRDPKPIETETCIKYLENQIELLKPDIIVCLGRVSAIRLISKNFKVTKEHGIFYNKDSRFIMGTFHPAAVLRNPHNKPLVLEDFYKLREKILEISPKTYDMR